MKKEELRERAENRSRTMRTAKGKYYYAIPMSELNLLINRLDEPEKVVVPQFVADYLEKTKKEISLLRVFEIANGLNELDMWRKEYNWIRVYHLDFARAWLDGYEIEKEPLYFISFPTPDRGNINMWRNTDTGSYYFAKSSSVTSQDGYKCVFTEKEIKEHDERFWLFARPVKVEEK